MLVRKAGTIGVLLILLLLWPFAVVGEVPGNVDVMIPDWISSLAVVNQQAYVTTFEQVYHVNLQIQAVTLLEEIGTSYTQPANNERVIVKVDYIYGDGENIVGINLMDEKIYAFTPQKNSLTLTDEATFYIPGNNADGEESVFKKEIAGGILQNNHLYLQIREMNGTLTIHDFDLRTETHIPLPFKNVVGVCAYEDGLLLGLIDDEHNLPDREENPWVYILNPKTGDKEKLFQLPFFYAQGVAYDQQSQLIYYFYDGKVYAQSIDGAEPSLGAYMPSAYNSGLSFLAEDVYFYTSMDRLYGRNINPRYLPEKVLKIYGHIEDDVVKGFSARYPNLPLVFTNPNPETIQDFALKVMADGGGIDIYIAEGSMLGILMEKGYCFNLSNNERLFSQFNRMYDYIKKEISLYNEPMAMPVELYGSTWMYHRDVCKG